MDDQLARLYSRWRTADEADRDEEADAAFRALTEAVIPQHAVSPQFTVRTMDAVANAVAADARRVKWMRRTLALGGIAGLIAMGFSAPFALSLISTALVATLNGIIAAIVWVATGPDLNLWSVIGSLGRASAAFIADPTVTIAMLAMQGIAIAALVALRRLLGSDREFLE
jgi:preprotein translocase subunit SecF